MQVAVILQPFVDDHHMEAVPVAHQKVVSGYGFAVRTAQRQGQGDGLTGGHVSGGLGVEAQTARAVMFRFGMGMIVAVVVAMPAVMAVGVTMIMGFAVVVCFAAIVSCIVIVGHSMIMRVAVVVRVVMIMSVLLPREGGRGGQNEGEGGKSGQGQTHLYQLREG
jgi:hypothetical protein